MSTFNKYNDNQNTEYEEYKEMQIQKWINNGMSKGDAEQLMYDSQNDGYAGDLDMDSHSDITIDERAKPYGGFGLTEEEIKDLENQLE